MLLLKLFYLTIICFSLSSSFIDAKLYPIAVRLPLNGTEPPSGASLWPAPVSLNVQRETFFISKQKLTAKHVNLNRCQLEIVESLWSHYQNVLFPPKLPYREPGSNDAQMNTVTFSLLHSESVSASEDCSRAYYPHIESQDEEAYELEVTASEAKLSSHTIWGLVRALESFSQLIYSFPDNRLAINRTTISDKPRFVHRGIMLDSARHYMPKRLIKKHLDAMMYAKLNVFHWHITDDQSFPFESDTFPDLHKKGAFTPEHTFSKADIREIIEFARIRGIRVIPEFDTPGHTYSWGLGYPDLITVCWNDNKPLQAIYNVHGAREILNPIEEYTYQFLKDLYAEIKNTFVDPYIHLGMDEVYYSCWKSNPDIQAWMRERNYTDINQVEEYFMANVLRISREIGYKSIVWQDVWDNDVPVFSDTILQVWKNNDSQTETQWKYYLSQTTQQGYKTILSSPWYLNYIKYGSDWYDFYNVEPYDFEGTDAQKSLIIGGEACLWSEYVDGANSLSRFWPRAGAVAERLWSESKWNDVEEAKFRLDEHRCRLLRRGIEAGPVFNSFCGDYEVYMKNSLVSHPIFNYEDTGNSASSISASFTLGHFVALIIFNLILKSIF